MNVDLPSGAKLVVTIAPFVDSNALMKSVLRSIRGVPLKETFGAELDMKNPAFIALMAERILSVAVSDEVETALFQCALRASYKDVKVTKQLFDDPELGESAREDYFKIARTIIEVNCGPFFRQTFSELKALLEKLPDTQKSPSSATTVSSSL